MIKNAGKKLLKRLKICLKNCHDFVPKHEKHLKFSQNKLQSMWKKCGKFQVEIFYTFEVTSDFSSCGSVNQKTYNCKCNRVRI